MKKAYIYILGFAVLILILSGLIFTLLIEGDTEDIFAEKYTINIHNCTSIESDTNEIVKEIKSMLSSTDVKSHFLIPIVKVIVNNKPVNKFCAIPIYGMNYMSYLSNPDMLTFANHREDEDYFFKSINDNSDFKDFKKLLANGNDSLTVKHPSDPLKEFEFIIRPDKNSSNLGKQEFNSFQALHEILDSLIKIKKIKKGSKIDVFYLCNTEKIGGIIQIDLPPAPSVPPVPPAPPSPQVPSLPPAPEDENLSNDRDGDGILNNEDKCPDLVGVIENNGCPIKISHEGLSFSLKSGEDLGLKNDNIIVELIISELVYGTEEVSRTVTYPGFSGSSFPNKEEANKILKLLNEASDLRVTVALKSDGIKILQKTFNHLSLICDSNRDCGFAKIP